MPWMRLLKVRNETGYRFFNISFFSVCLGYILSHSSDHYSRYTTLH